MFHFTNSAPVIFVSMPPCLSVAEAFDCYAGLAWTAEHDGELWFERRLVAQAFDELVGAGQPHHY